ncbi:MAG TPA: AMP-binding protein, partial [Gemmatimonadaceae bacterium]|nr:AMP-binding protein [Gemmatimonadaceae bacterium]
MVQRPWLAHYDEGVPASLDPYPDLTLVDFLSATARDEPEHPVVLFKGASVTAARLERLSNAFAAALLDLGVTPGDRVALLLPNCPQFLIAEFGAWKAGAIVAPLNPASHAGELESLLAQLEPRVLITISSCYARAKVVQRHLRIPHLLVTSIKEHRPRGSRLLFTLFREAREGHRVSLSPEDQWFPELLESYRGAHRPRLAITPDADATLLPTSGTCGAAKLVLGTHRAAVAGGFELSAWLRDVADTDSNVMMLALPLHHTLAMLPLQGLALMARLPLALVPDLMDVHDLLKTLRRVRPAFLSGSPAVFASIPNDPLVRAGKIDFSSLEVCLTSAAPMRAATRERCERLMGCTILDGYGLAESQSIVTVNPAAGAHKMASVGLPLPDTDVRIRSLELPHDELPSGTIGEIWVSRPHQMRGYWRKSGDVPSPFA